MSFVEDALVQLAQQSVGGSNLYSYSPANGDTIADVQAADYFSQSRFVNQDGWVNGFIFCVLADGSYIVQIGTGGATGSQFGAGGGDIPLLVENVRGSANVHMANADYTMTDAEARCAVISVHDVGNGTKTLTWPSTSDGMWPAVQTIISIGGNNQFYIASETGGATGLIEYTPVAATLAENTVAIYPGFGAINLSQYFRVVTRGASNGVIVESTAGRTIGDADVGTAIESTNAAATTFTIPAGLKTANMKFNVRSSGAGGVTIAGSGGVTVTGKTSLALNGSCIVFRRGSNENYVCF